jgi:hypothetical protein
MRIRTLAVLASAIGLLLFTGNASALSYHTGNSIPGLGSAEVVGYDIYGSSHSSYAVGFETTLDGAMGVSFCGDLLHSIGLNGAYSASAFDYALLAPEYEEAASIANRWSFDLDSLSASSGDATAGVQLAIWETIYGADFTVTSATSATLAAMNTVLGGLYPDGAGNTVFLNNTAGRRDVQNHFFTPETAGGGGAGSNPVPEPTAALLFAVGLCVIQRRSLRGLGQRR